MAAPSWAPTLDRVARILHARGRNEHGAVIAFGPESNPTDQQVRGLIEEACTEVEGEAGAIPLTLHDQAAGVAAIGAAALVEMSHFPTQTGDDPNIYAELQRIFERRLASLVRNAQAVAAGAEPGAAGQDSGQWANGFPGVVGTTLSERY